MRRDPGDPATGAPAATAGDAVASVEAPPAGRARWGRILFAAGLIAMLVGGIDPLEGSLLVLPGSALAALGTWLAGSGRRVVTFRVLVFVLVAVGVGAMWGLTAIGGIGGPGDPSMAWGALILPALVGWSLGIWGPGSPRWAQLGGLVAGAWYLAVAVLVVTLEAANRGAAVVVPLAAALGALTLGGSALRLWRERGSPR